MESEVKTFKLLPARPGTCSVCACDHPPHMAHNLQSLFYGVRFKLKYGRDPTWADACAHLTEEQKVAWREGMDEAGVQWSEPESEPIADPYAANEPPRRDL